MLFVPYIILLAENINPIRDKYFFSESNFWQSRVDIYDIKNFGKRYPGIEIYEDEFDHPAWTSPLQVTHASTF